LTVSSLVGGWTGGKITCPARPSYGPLSNNDAGPHKGPAGTEGGLRDPKFEPAHPAGLLAIT